jgi:hypothetical protein
MKLETGAKYNNTIQMNFFFDDISIVLNLLFLDKDILVIRTRAEHNWDTQPHDTSARGTDRIL